jgi:Fe-S cluster biogenesis protein NfuA/nitrite reductase/ring-hydroxylating ferredoxin subunit
MDKALITTDRGLAGDTNSEINLLGERLQKLLGQIETVPYPLAKELIQECMEAVPAFYGHGLSRIIQIVKGAGPEGRPYHELIHDDVVKGLLLIHDSHPLDLEARLRGALDKVRPYLMSHGGNVELISLENEVAKLRLQGTCKSCASSSVTLELAIRHAIEQACPDLIRFDVEGGVPDAAHLADTQPAGSKAVVWHAVEDAGRLAEGDWLPVRIEQLRLVICKVNGTFYAYRNRCPACNVPFDAGSFAGGFLSCARGHHYDVVHAGSCKEIPAAHLDPFPLLFQEGAVKVALTREVVYANPARIARGA